MFADCDGGGALPGTRRMDGFNRETHSGGPKGVKEPM